MRKGTVKYWNDQKGYGFISPDDNGQDVFFHISKWALNQRPKKGLRVSFDHQLEGNGKPSATEVCAEHDSHKNAIKGTPNGRTIRRRKSKGLFGGIAALGLIAAGLFNAWPQLEQQIFPQETSQVSVTEQDSTTHQITGDPNIDRTISLIKQGGPYPYPHKDGSTFENRERLLPQKPYGYYREFTVPTPGSQDRGPRRIVTGGKPPVIYYYTADHYRSFKKLDVPK
ncbi:cold shock domain-containing protein [Cardiobacteriaceae bacterium TAE3-ERU3]|nr:cold shock domain-containing protein [Cardiobacteriaceae bacterium TAE3-ERU3]